MELSLAFIATKLNEKFPVAMRDPEGMFVDYSSIKRFPDLPMFHSARLWASRPDPEKLTGTIPILTSSSPKAFEEDEAVKGIIWIGKSEPPYPTYALWISSRVAAIEVLDAVLDLFDRFNDWSARVRNELLERKPIAEVVQLLGEATENPYWYADPALRVLQMSDDRSLSEVSPKWDYQRKTGRYPAEVISDIVSSGDLERMNRRSHAWLFDDAESYSIPFVTKTIFLNGGVYGYLYIIELHGNSCVCDLELAEALGNLIATYVQHSNFGLSGTKRFADQMLRACLAGNDVTDDERIELLEMINWSDVPGFAVAVFDRGNDRSGDGEAPQVQVELLRENLNFGRIFAYDVYVVCVSDTTKPTYVEIEERVRAACEKLGWKAGLSDEFDDFAALSDYYGQAQIALRKGQSLEPEGTVYPYRNFSLAYLCQKLALDTDRSFYMHPDIDRLIAYDKETNSELVATLDAFLSNERNISKTAKDLFLHRNSVIYRIDKIKSLMTTDLEDDDNRVSLLVALKVWSYENARQDK